MQAKGFQFKSGCFQKKQKKMFSNKKTVKQILDENNSSIARITSTLYQIIYVSLLFYSIFTPCQIPFNFFASFFGISFLINYSIYKFLLRKESLLLLLLAFICALYFLHAPCYTVIETLTLMGLSPISFYIRRLFLPFEVAKTASLYTYRSSIVSLASLFVLCLVIGIYLPSDATLTQVFFKQPFYN